MVMGCSLKQVVSGQATWDDVIEIHDRGYYDDATHCLLIFFSPLSFSEGI